jgi:hypothetical protein
MHAEFGVETYWKPTIWKVDVMEVGCDLDFKGSI